MEPSRTIRVRKRDGNIEAFDVGKVAGVFRRALAHLPGECVEGGELARAVHLYLLRTNRRSISSSAVFEMAVKALHRVQRGEAAEMLELHRTLRNVRRRLLRIRHADGRVTQWDKTWLAEWTRHVWRVSRRTARMLAGEVEYDLLPQEETDLSREEVIDRLNEQVAQWGLAEAVPAYEGDEA